MTRKFKYTAERHRWVCGVAVNMSKKLGIPTGHHDDAIQEAALAYHCALETWNPEYSDSRDWALKRMWWALGDYARKLSLVGVRQNHKACAHDIYDAIKTTDPWPRVEAGIALDSLGHAYALLPERWRVLVDAVAREEQFTKVAEARGTHKSVASRQLRSAFERLRDAA